MQCQAVKSINRWIDVGSHNFAKRIELMSVVRHWPLAVCLASLACNCPAARSAETQLLSITGINLHPLKSGSQPTGQYIAGFNIETWDVRVIAVCHIPGGWTISAGKNANPEGVLSGSAGEGVAFLDADSFNQLTELVLVRVGDYNPIDKGDCTKNCTPATFAGNFYVGQYGSESEPELQRLQPSNIRLTPARRCPDPV